MSSGGEEKSKVSAFKLCMSLFGVLLVLVVVLATVFTVSDSSKSGEDGSGKKQEEVLLVDESKTSDNEGNSSETSNSVSDGSKNTATSTDNSVSNTSKNGSDSSLENSSDLVESDNGGEGSLVFREVEEPNLGVSKGISAIVSGKSSFVVEDSSYAYALNLIVPNGEEYDIVKYFCSRKTYDAISTGETVKVTYQEDENGVISVTTITKLD